jgi:hypothetical protein
LKPRLYLVLIAAVMIAAAIIVIVLSRDLPEHLLGSIALLGGIAVLLNTMLDLTGNGNGKGPK